MSEHSGTRPFGIETVIETTRASLPGYTGVVPLHTPDYSANPAAWSYVKQCIDTGWVSSAGAFVDRFEQMLAEYTGSPHAVAVVNGTAALHVALELAGVRDGDEVLMPALTFVATANAARYCRAIPHFVDIDERTLGVDAERLGDYLKQIAEQSGDGPVNRQTGRRLAALVPMHTFGQPCDMEALAVVCERFRLTMVEDAAESLGTFYKKQHTGTFGKLGILSFNGNKTITCGGGGAILTADPDLAQTAKHVTTTAKCGKAAWEYYHDVTAYNHRLPNLNAALGCAEMERLDQVIQAKRAIAERYIQAFADIEGVTIYREQPFARSNYWLNILMLDPEHAGRRDDLINAMNEAKLLVRPVWNPMHTLPMHADCPRMELPITESLAQRIINLPSSPHLL